METCLGDLNLHWCIIYLDDIVIFSTDLASHLERLEAVLWKLEEAGLKLKPSKCELFQWQITYLGHIVSAQGIATDEAKIEAIMKWPVLTNVMEFQSFLGFMGYYWQFIPIFTQAAHPLHKLTLGENAGKKKAAIQWNDRCQQAFHDLKRLCTTAPILASADFTWPFKLQTNACGSGLGAVLYQTHEDSMDTVISYPSRCLSNAKSHYSTHKLEFLALKWAVVEKFQEYLYGSTFDVHTNNNPLTYVLTMAKLDAVSHWWVTSLSNNNVWLYYWAGKTSINADAFLRVSWPGYMHGKSGTHLQVTAAAVWAVQEASLKGPTSPTEANSCDLHFLDSVQVSQQVACMTKKDWHEAQQVDQTLSLVITRLGMEPWGKDSPNGLSLLTSITSCVSKTTSDYKRVSYIGEPDLGNLRRSSFSWFCQLHPDSLFYGDAMMRLAI